MLRRGLAVWLAVALVAALVPSAASQSLPVIAPGDDHTVVSVEVPLAGAAGSGRLQVPVDGGILDIQVDPILLPGPGGSVDVGAYLAEARLLLPSGVAVPLPSMVIRSQDRAIEGPAAEALAELADEVAALRAELEALPATLDDPEAEPDPEPEPEPAEPQPDPIGENLSALQTQLEALAMEAAWMQALADEAASAAGAGAAEQAAIAQAMLGRIEAGLALLMDGIEAAQAAAQPIADSLPDAPEGPGLPSSPPPSSSGSASSSSAPSDPPAGGDDEMPSAEDLAALMDGLEEAHASAEEALAQAEAAGEELPALAAGILAMADEAVDEQAAIDGARAAVALAEQALADAESGARAKVAELQDELEGQSDGPRSDADEAAAAAQAALDDAIADLQWASDWIAAAQASASPLVQDSLADAQHSVDSAMTTAQNVRTIVERYSAAQAAPVTNTLAGPLAAADQPLADAAMAAESAQAELAAALDAIGSIPGGLEPAPGPGEPGEPGSAPSGPELPPMPGAPDMPASFDADTMTVCVDGMVAQACFHYRSPLESEPGSLTVLLAVPAGVGGLSDLVDGLSGDDPVGSLPIPDLPVPTPTGLPLPGLPGGSSGPSPDPGSPSPSPSPSASTSSSAAPVGLPTSSSTGSSPAAATAPHLQAVADRETLPLKVGEQGVVVLTVRNDGTAADRVRVTAQTDAPIAFDTTTESMHLGPGDSGEFTVRITPLQAGSGTLDLLATGDEAQTAIDSVLIAVEAAPAAASSASIVASIEPTTFRSAIGQGMPVTLHIANHGSLADRVAVQASGAGVQVEPSMLEVALQPGESVSRQVQVTPMMEGASQIVLRITSERGADLKPIVLLDGTEALGSPSSGMDGDGQDGGALEDESKDSPGFGMVLLAAAIGMALLVRRKLRT